MIITTCGKLISRELAALKKQGYITKEVTPGKRNYNSRITLTDDGEALAKKIYAKALEVQGKVDEGVSTNDLVIFYSVLERLHQNLEKIMKDSEAQE